MLAEMQAEEKNPRKNGKEIQKSVNEKARSNVYISENKWKEVRRWMLYPGALATAVRTPSPQAAALRLAATIVDGRAPHAVLLELFTEHGAGTLIHP